MLERIEAALAAEDYAGAMTALADLRAPVDEFFDRVMVNADEPELPASRLRLLGLIRSALGRVADFRADRGCRALAGLREDRRRMAKWVYGFGEGRADGTGAMKDLLGGKGAGLAEMTTRPAGAAGLHHHHRGLHLVLRARAEPTPRT